MPRKYALEFFEAKTPVTEFVTKFGGQPTWIQEPEWPLSKTTGELMRFIGQIALDEKLFGSIGGEMAYLFMTDNPDVDGTWEAEGEENALIIQPGNNSTRIKAVTQGPSLFRMVKKLFRSRLVPEACEFGVRFIESEDLEWLEEKQRFALPDEQADTYLESLQGNKIGGTPGFLQGDEFPTGGPVPWKLLLQLDSTKVPFNVNFGDAGVGYAFISGDGVSGKFLWQCC